MTGADFSALSTTNFAVSVWVRTTTAITAARNDSLIFQGNSAGGGDIDFQLSNGSDQSDNDAWGSSISGVNWVGSARGTENSAILNTWIQLAFIKIMAQTLFILTEFLRVH